MALETFIGTYIDGLNAANPTSSDQKSEGDDHLRGIKLVLQNTFPNVSGAVTSTHTELNKLDGFTGVVGDLNVIAGGAAAGVSATEFQYLNGVTSAIQTQITAKAAKGANSDITSLAGLTTPLSVAQGGMGTASLADHYVLIGSGASAVTPVAPSTSGYVLTSRGASLDPNFQAIAVPAGGVTQSKLATSTETDAGGLTANHHVVSAGAYCFYPQVVWASGSGTDSTSNMQILNCSGSSYVRTASYVTLIYINTTAAGGDMSARFRYVTASPPYNLGDGDIPLFVWCVMEGNTMGSIQVSRTPPWAYNGPTSISAERYDGDRAFRKLWMPDNDQTKKGALKASRMPMAQRLKTKGSYQEVEIDQSIKNADMDLIPNPFFANNLSGKQVVLLDPMSPDLLKLDEFHEAGENIVTIIRDYLNIGNTAINRAVPNGVMAVDFSFK